MAESPVRERHLDRVSVCRSVDEVLREFLADKTSVAERRKLPSEITALVHEFVFTGGKRIRPLLCVTGWLAAGGDPEPPGYVVRAAASLEMFHTFVLIHDDVMDGSMLRRGAATVHKRMASLHAGGRDPDRLGEHAAILVGDLAHGWADELLNTASIPESRLPEVRRVIMEMRCEVVFGQYLDLTTAGRPSGCADGAEEIIRYKTTSYTVERPLHLGVALAAGSAAVRAALSQYASPIGEAFQLRDDLLGAFGDPEITGKSASDDLRDGKNTLLMALAVQRADTRQRAVLRDLVGTRDLDDDGIRRVRAILVEVGARAAVEAQIRVCVSTALTRLARSGLPPAASAVLRDLADAAVSRVR